MDRGCKREGAFREEYKEFQPCGCCALRPIGSSECKKFRKKFRTKVVNE